MHDVLGFVCHPNCACPPAKGRESGQSCARQDLDFIFILRNEDGRVACSSAGRWEL